MLKKGSFGELYRVSDVWLYILEYIPGKSLICTFSVLDKSHNQLIHSINTYAHILMRDFIDYGIIPKFMVKKILSQFDYKRSLSKIINTKIKVMKLVKRVGKSETVLSPHEFQGLKKSFQQMFIHFNGLLRRIVNDTLNINEHRLFFLAEQLETVILPKEVVDEDDEEDENDDQVLDYWDDYYGIVYPIRTPPHAITHLEKHEFETRHFHGTTSSHKIFFCNCGMTYSVSEDPIDFFEPPTLCKDEKQKILYPADEERFKFLFLKKNTWQKEDNTVSFTDLIIPHEWKKIKGE